MPNRKAKENKRKKVRLNEKWKKEGRTAKQHKKWLAKQETKGTQMPVWSRQTIVIKLKDILEASVTGNIKGVKGYTGFIIPLQWKAKKKSLEQSIAKTTGYSMVGGISSVQPTLFSYRNR